MITPYNVLRHELTGVYAKIYGSSPSDYSCHGMIIDETRNTLKIKTKEGVKTVPKDCVTLELELEGHQNIRIDGKLLVGRPAERIKKKYRIKFI